MATTSSQKMQHLEWAVQARTRNQQSALRLLRLFEEHADQWKTTKWARAAHALLSASFSLWRAAFLADKSGLRDMVFSQAREFLERIVEDNAISYTQDRKSREWTFDYYSRNARSSLEILAKYWPE